ncbi:MAG TPA: hypothetical protein VGL94_09160 [Ktedonobacteraceae bacterium]
MSTVDSIITAIVILAHITFFTRSQMPKVESSALSIMILLTVALFTILTTILLFLVLVAIKMKAEIGTLEGLVNETQ